MNWKRIKKIILRAISIGVLFFSMLSPKISKSCTRDFDINSSKNVLIYNSHYCEDYQGRPIKEGSLDLCSKLNAKGINAVYLDYDFSEMNGYNNSYYSSRGYLEGIDLNKYDLIIDYHRDYSPTRRVKTTTFNTGTANIKGVLTRDCPEYNYKEQLVGKLAEEANKVYGEGIWEETYHYNRGINFYNQDLNKNAILLEVGDNESSLWDVKAANTIIAKAVSETINNAK